jgi:hypothetical protein
LTVKEKSLTIQLFLAEKKNLTGNSTIQKDKEKSTAETFGKIILLSHQPMIILISVNMFVNMFDFQFV